jgi:hypothetical protein
VMHFFMAMVCDRCFSLGVKVRQDSCFSRMA